MTASYRVHPSLATLVVPLAKLRDDPRNARKHPPKSLDAIRASLERFGQRKPIVVQRQGMIVRAGNGLFAAARALRWDEIAAVVVDEADAEATATDARDPSGQPYRNRGVYNDDTDLCLRVLKDGFCTILFLAFLAEKMPTMKYAGGMTPQYQGDGRLRMAQELQRAHPDVTTITRKWGRWQHHVDYSRFRRNRLVLRPGVEIPSGVNNYGMELKIDDERGGSSTS